jgi:signal transduction histidine kinase
MLHLRDYPIAKQLTWVNLLVTTVALLLSCGAFLVYDVISARNALVRDVSLQAEIMGSNTISALVFDDPESAEDTLSALRASRNILYAGIYTPDGRALAEYWRDGKGQTPRLPSTTLAQRESHFFAADQLAVLHPIVQEGKPIGAVYIRSDSQLLENRLKRYAQTIIAVLLLSLAAATFFAWRSQRAVSEPLVRLAETARVVSREKNYSLQAEASHGHDEVNVLIEAFNEMLRQIQRRDTDLQLAHHGLEMRVKDRTRELKRAEWDLRALSRRLLYTQDEERRRIARELHEGAGQVLAALSLKLSVIHGRTARLSPALMRQVEDCIAMVEQILGDLRTTAYLLHPPLLEEAGLDSAIRWFVEGFSERSKIPIRMDISASLGRLPREVEIATFRILQECLTNIHRHSGSRDAIIRIARDAHEVSLEVKDHGRGMPKRAAAHSLKSAFRECKRGLGSSGALLRFALAVTVHP